MVVFIGILVVLVCWWYDPPEMVNKVCVPVIKCILHVMASPAMGKPVSIEMSCKVIVISTHGR